MSAPDGENAPIATVRPLSWEAVASAVRQLTIVGTPPATDRPGRSLLWYPLIGLVLGGLWLLVDLAVSSLSGRLAASIAVGVVAVLTTRRWPPVGAGRTIAGLASSSEQALRYAYGQLSALPVCWAALVWLVQLFCLIRIDRWRPIGLVCAPLFGRWSMVVLAFGSRAARLDGKRGKFAKGVTFEEFGWASTATLALVFWGTGLLGILLLVCTAIPVVALRVALHWRLDGITPASLGAACAIAEIVPLAVLALI